MPTITDGKPHRKQLHESVVCWANMKLDLVCNACCFPVRLPCTQRVDIFSSSMLSVRLPMPDCLASEPALHNLHALMGVATAGFATGQGTQYTCIDWQKLELSIQFVRSQAGKRCAHSWRTDCRVLWRDVAGMDNSPFWQRQGHAQCCVTCACMHACMHGLKMCILCKGAIGSWHHGS